MKKPDNMQQNSANHQNGSAARNKVYRIAICGFLLAFALLLGYVESFIPFSFAVPGAKLGLANMAVVLCLFLLGPKYAVAISIGRILISSFLFGNSFGLLYSLLGGIFSFAVMFLYHKYAKGEMLFTSCLGGISHNLAQLFVASVVVKTGVIFYYLPVLILVGLMTGLLNGFIAKLIHARISKVKWMGE